MTEYQRTCPYCGNRNTNIEEETYDYHKDELHILLEMSCDRCGNTFIGEDDYILIASGTGKDPDELAEALDESYKGE